MGDIALIIGGILLLCAYGIMCAIAIALFGAIVYFGAQTLYHLARFLLGRDTH